MTTGQAISRIRAFAHNTIEQAAAVLGVDARQLAEWELGVGAPPPAVLAEVRVMYGFDAEVLAALWVVHHAEAVLNSDRKLYHLTAHRQLLGLGVD